MKVVITGGCGYVGSVLVNKLIKNNFVKVLDADWLGNNLKANVILSKEKIKIRKIMMT